MQCDDNHKQAHISVLLENGFLYLWRLSRIRAIREMDILMGSLIVIEFKNHIDQMLVDP